MGAVSLHSLLIFLNLTLFMKSGETPPVRVRGGDFNVLY
jgi:hypothetical protein